MVKGIAHIHSSFNNTIITISDLQGGTVCWASAGTVGFKGSRKSTPFAAQRTAEACAGAAKKVGMKEIEVRIKGPGSGRESSIRGLQAAGLAIRAIEDVTPYSILYSVEQTAAAGATGPAGLDLDPNIAPWLVPVARRMSIVD